MIVFIDSTAAWCQGVKSSAPYFSDAIISLRNAYACSNLYDLWFKVPRNQLNNYY